jgi:hypothetical protein
MLAARVRATGELLPARRVDGLLVGGLPASLGWGRLRRADAR